MFSYQLNGEFVSSLLHLLLLTFWLFLPLWIRSTKFLNKDPIWIWIHNTECS